MCISVRLNKFFNERMKSVLTYFIFENFLSFVAGGSYETCVLCLPMHLLDRQPFYKIYSFSNLFFIKTS